MQNIGRGKAPETIQGMKKETGLLNQNGKEWKRLAKAWKGSGKREGGGKKGNAHAMGKRP